MEEIIKNLNYQPANLTAIDLENPIDLMTSYFLDHPLHESRENTWELFKGWLYYSSDFADEKMINYMLFYYTRTIEFLNASYIYIEKKKMESKEPENRSHLIMDNPEQ